MTVAFSKLTPPASSYQPKKFGLLSLVVSVAVALGLVALGPSADAVAWSGLFGQRDSDSSEVRGTPDQLDLPAEASLTSRPFLGGDSGGNSIFPAEIARSSPSAKLRPVGLRRLPQYGWNADTCQCTGNANDGGLGWLELHFSLGETHSEDHIIATFKESIEVWKTQQGGSIMYPGGTYDSYGAWNSDDAGHDLFNFTFPSDGKKITQTEFRFCLGADYTNLGCTASGDSTCGTTSVAGYDGCYYWNVHTSCSTYLIGENLLLGGELKVEIVEWADRSTPQNVCKPCGNNVLDGAEECDDGRFVLVEPNGEGCTSECLCDTTAGYEPDPINEGQCKKICGNGDRDAGEECDTELPGCIDCECDKENGFYPDPSGNEVCLTPSCPAGTTICEVANEIQCICGSTCNGLNNGGVCKLVCPTTMTTSDGNVPVSSPVQATNSSGAVIEYNTPSIGDASVICVQSSGSVFRIGTTEVTCTATKGDYDDECSFVVRVVDTVPPTFDDYPGGPGDGEGCPIDMTDIATIGSPGGALQATGPAGATFTFVLPTATDAVDAPVTVTCDNPVDDVYPIGTTTVTCTAVNNSHSELGTPAADDLPLLSTDCSFVVRVVDTVPPTFDDYPGGPGDGEGCPIDMTDIATIGSPGGALQATGPAGATFTFVLPTATDAVDAPVTVTCDNPVDDVYPIGTTTVTCTAVDNSHSELGTPAADDLPLLSTDCSFVVRVVDTVPPTFDDYPGGPGDGEGCPIDMTDIAAIGSPGGALQATSPAGATFTFALPTATDAVDAPVTVTCDNPVDDVYPIGTTTVTCTAVDNSHSELGTPAADDLPLLSTDCSFVVRVVDTLPPTCKDSTENPNDDPIIEEATSPAGATVTFSTDLFKDTADASLELLGCVNSVSDEPVSSGMYFPPGPTSVLCTAKDEAGLEATCPISIVVKCPCDTPHLYNGQCIPEPVCGDGVREGWEECDLGDYNGLVGSGCDSNCLFEHCHKFNGNVHCGTLGVGYNATHCRSCGGSPAICIDADDDCANYSNVVSTRKLRGITK